MRRGFTLVELMVVIAILGLLTSVLATSVVSKMQYAKHELDKKVMKDVYDQLLMKLEMDKRIRKKLARSDEFSQAKGRKFYEACFKLKIFDNSFLTKMVSASSKDIKMDDNATDDLDAFELDELGCSWAGPRGNEIRTLIHLQGKRRRVVMCSNTRNFHIYEGEVLVMMSEGSVANYMFLEDTADWGWSIDEEQWANPASMFGTVKPFDGVFD